MTDQININNENNQQAKKLSRQLSNKDRENFGVEFKKAMSDFSELNDLIEDNMDAPPNS